MTNQLTKYQTLCENYGLGCVRAVLETVGVNYSTYHSWETGRRTPPDYVISLITTVIVYIDMLKDSEDNNRSFTEILKHKADKIERAQDYLHDGRFREAMAIIDNL